MAPTYEEILDQVDDIIDLRSPGQTMRHPDTDARVQFVFTDHGRRLGQNAVIADGRRVLPACISARRLQLRQHLRALPQHRAEPSSLPILAAQCVDAQAFARDAQTAPHTPREP